MLLAELKYSGDSIIKKSHSHSTSHFLFLRVSFLILEQEKIAFTDISKLVNEPRFNDYSRSILRFCFEWLNGQNTFEIHTSGSTGIPKSILWTRELMIWSIKNTALALQLKKGMHGLLCIDSNKAGGKMMLARALFLEMSLEIVEPQSYPFQNTNSVLFDFAAMVPIQIHQLHTSGGIAELEKVDVLIIGGAPLTIGLNLALQSLKTKIYSTYGMTETASHIALKKINGGDKQESFIPLNEVQITKNDNDCAIIKTPFHNNLVTNDIIEIHEHNSFEVIGRYDNIINSGGYKISLEKVEAAIDKVLTELKINFFNFCAYKQPDEKLGEELIIIFETEPLQKSIEDQILDGLKSHLDKFEIPKHFYYLGKLAYTASGKIDRGMSGEIVNRIAS